MSAEALRPHDPAATLLGRAYAVILAWPCPICGGAFPCPCDQNETLPAVSGGDAADSAMQGDPPKRATYAKE